MKRIVFVVAVVVVLLAGCNAKEQLGANIDAGQRHVEIMQDGIADGQARLDELKNDPDVDPAEVETLQAWIADRSDDLESLQAWLDEQSVIVDNSADDVEAIGGVAAGTLQDLGFGAASGALLVGIGLYRQWRKAKQANAEFGQLVANIEQSKADQGDGYFVLDGTELKTLNKRAGVQTKVDAARDNAVQLNVEAKHAGTT